MVKLSNKYNLPSGLASSIKHINSSYSRGQSDISATSLISSPTIKILSEKYNDQIETDVADLFYTILGTAVHEIIDKSDKTKNVIKEKRFFGKCKGWVISGAIDRLIVSEAEFETEKIMFADIEDYKCTSVWAAINDKKEWHQQLNVYAWLVRQNGYSTKSLKIIVLARDWQKSKAADSQKNNGNYPAIPFVPIDIPLWTNKQQDNYVENRVLLHQEADHLFNTMNVQVGCTDEERWKNPPIYAVKIKNQKKALKLFDLEVDAQDYAKNIRESYIEVRPSIARRCKDYCNVKQFCELAKKEGYV